MCEWVGPKYESENGHKVKMEEKLLHTTINGEGKKTRMEKLLLNPIFKFSTSLSSSNRSPANCHTNYNCYCASSSSSLVSLVPLFFVALVITFRFGLPFLLLLLGYDDTIIDSVVSGRYPWRVNRLCSQCPRSLSCSPRAACTLDGFSEHEKWSTSARIIAKWKINASIRSGAVFPTQIYSVLYFWLCTQRTQEHQLNTGYSGNFYSERLVERANHFIFGSSHVRNANEK